MGIVLDKTGRGAGARDARCDVTAHAVHAARQVAGAATTRLLLESCRRIYVCVYCVSIIHYI